jgi:Lar family restriction alleviation protein
MMADLNGNLKPCPFCGAQQYDEHRIGLRLAKSSVGYVAVLCSCGGSGPIENSEEEAIKGWNARNSSNQSLPRYPFDFSESATAVDLKGNLRSLGLSTILQILSSEGKTGVLCFAQGQATRAICFKDGKIVAASGKEGQRLGQILYDKGLISREKLQEALTKAKGAGKRLGEILLDLDYITEANLKELVRYQILEALLDISLWTEADFEYRECPVEFDERGIHDINTMGIILQAAARKDERAAA